jgi:hypothetical protein
MARPRDPQADYYFVQTKVTGISPLISDPSRLSGHERPTLGNHHLRSYVFLPKRHSQSARPLERCLRS